jgi:hypothetical protein
MFINLLASSAAVAAIAKNRPNLAIAISLLIAFISSANLAFEFAARAREHGRCRGIYHELASELERCRDDPAVCRDLRAKMIEATGEEPAVFGAALHDAHNQAILALGRNQDDMFVLTPWQHFMRHVLPFRGTRFETRAERRARTTRAGSPQA